MLDRTTENRRLLIIGLDAADKDLIADWAASGALPTFHSLLDTAIWGDVENPRGLEAGSCWTTFYFGLSPAVTGQFDGSRHFDPATYEHVSYRPETAPQPPIWQHLSWAGRLCAVIDAPYSYPLDDLNGIKVIDRGPHVPTGGGRFTSFRTHPTELAQEIVERFGPDPAGGRTSDDFSLDGPTAVRRFRDIYLERIANKTELVLHYWRERRWDFFLCVFTEAHCVGHRCWHVHDEQDPAHDPGLSCAVGDPIKDVYIALDQAVGRLIKEAEGEAQIIVYLSHGMGPRYSGTRLLDRVLARLDDRPIQTLNSPALRAVRRVWRAAPSSLRRPLYRVRDRVSHDGFQPDRPGRRFFEVFANDRTGGVRVNLRGREAHGIVEPGREYEELCEKLIADLSEVINAETGEPVAKEIFRVRDHYSGERLDWLPDILVTWNRSNPINVVWSPKIGRVDDTGLLRTRSGDHRPVGRFFGVAPDWPHRRLNETVQAVDFATTIAQLLGADPLHSEGQTIEALMPIHLAATHDHS